MSETGPSSTNSFSMDAALPSMDSNHVNHQQVAMLKQKLDDEHSNYKRKLQAYQDSQQRQTTLIQKLQNKVLFVFMLFSLGMFGCTLNIFIRNHIMTLMLIKGFFWIK